MLLAEPVVPVSVPVPESVAVGLGIGGWLSLPLSLLVVPESAPVAVGLGIGGGPLVAESLVGLGIGPSLVIVVMGGWLSFAVSLPVVPSSPQATPESVSSNAPTVGRTSAGLLGGEVGRTFLEAMHHFGRPRRSLSTHCDGASARYGRTKRSMGPSSTCS